MYTYLSILLTSNIRVDTSHKPHQLSELTKLYSLLCRPRSGGRALLVPKLRTKKCLPSFSQKQAFFTSAWKSPLLAEGLHFLLQQIKTAVLSIQEPTPRVSIPLSPVASSKVFLLQLILSLINFVEFQFRI